MNIAFGAMAAPLTEQLKGYVSEDRLNLMERHNNAITLLSIHEILTEAETKKARQRLIRAIQIQLREEC